MKIVILYSSGLDSFLMYKLAKKEHPNAEVKCIFFAHGQDAQDVEMSKLPDFVTVRKIDWLGDDIKPLAKKSDPFAGAIYIPGRNLVFSVVAACQELPDQIWMGTMWDEDNQQATDKNEEFRKATSRLLSYVLSPFIGDVKLQFPFVQKQWTKEDAVNWALQNGVSKEELIETVSCWHQHGELPCGECKQCTKRMLVFGLNGFEEPYVVHPTKSKSQQENMLSYFKAFNNGHDLNRDERNMVDMMLRYFTDDRLDILEDIEFADAIKQQIKEAKD